MELVIEAEIIIERRGALGADISENTKHVVIFLESLIRRYPDQWNWLTVRLRVYRGSITPQPQQSNSQGRRTFGQ
jgi:lauroyl/myristoyl acyltransferase